MSNENKTALTAKDIINENFVFDKNGLTTCSGIPIERCMQEFASLQTQEKDKEIEELKETIFGMSKTIGDYGDLVDSLQSQLSEVIKERDEKNRIMVNRLLIMKDWLNPEPFSDIDACLNAIEHAIKSLTPTKEERKEGECEHIAVLIDNKPVYCCSKCDKIIDN